VGRPRGDQGDGMPSELVETPQDDRFLGSKITEERAAAYTRRFGDLVDGGCRIPLGQEQTCRRVGDVLAHCVLLFLSHGGSITPFAPGTANRA
jgi:hypothetical protein